MGKIGIFGSGEVARALSKRWRRAGHQILVSTRHGISPVWVAEADVEIGSLAQVAADTEIVVNALPGNVALDVLNQQRPLLGGKILIDVANAVELDSQGFASQLIHAPQSFAEVIQAALPETLVVKTSNTMHVSVMAAPDSLAMQPTAFLSGNDPAAKAKVAEFLHDLGWHQDSIVDLGDVDSARAPESFILMVRPLVRAFGFIPFALSAAR
jgi:predicted dinucleotide-binding enzyme